MATYQSKTRKNRKHKSADLIARHKKFLARESDTRMSVMESRINFAFFLINSDIHREFRGE